MSVPVSAVSRSAVVTLVVGSWPGLGDIAMKMIDLRVMVMEPNLMLRMIVSLCDRVP